MNGTPIPKPHIYGQPPKLSPTPHEYKRAFTNIQNTMSKVSDAYDAGYNFYRMIDWSDPETTKDILTKVVVSTFATLAVVHFVPLNTIALVGGVLLFGSNTAICKALIVTLTPLFVKVVQQKVESVTTLIRDARMAGGNEAIIEVSLFENQRWWAGLGFVKALMSGERNCWSDETGTIKQPSKEDFELPADEDSFVEWIDQDWVLSQKWAEIDAQGWQYLSNGWTNPRPSRIMGSFTRRRKWIRRMVLKQSAAA